MNNFTESIFEHKTNTFSVVNKHLLAFLIMKDCAYCKFVEAKGQSSKLESRVLKSFYALVKEGSGA